MHMYVPSVRMRIPSYVLHLYTPRTKCTTSTYTFTQNLRHLYIHAHKIYYIYMYTRTKCTTSMYTQGQNVLNLCIHAHKNVLYLHTHTHKLKRI